LNQHGASSFIQRPDDGIGASSIGGEIGLSIKRRTLFCGYGGTWT